MHVFTTERATVRIKRLEDAECSIVRIAEPVMHPNDNLVDVRYQIIIKEKNTNRVQELKENHLMRYWFKPEVEYHLNSIGFQIIAATEWMSERSPGVDTWSVCYVAKAK